MNERDQAYAEVDHYFLHKQEIDDLDKQVVAAALRFQQLFDDPDTSGRTAEFVARQVLLNVTRARRSLAIPAPPQD